MRVVTVRCFIFVDIVGEVAVDSALQRMNIRVVHERRLMRGFKASVRRAGKVHAGVSKGIVL